MNAGQPPPYGSQYPNLKEQPMTAQQVIVGYPVAMVGRYPMSCVCPACRQQIITYTRKKSGVLAWIICVILFITFLWPCCWIPFCVDSCKDTEHYCPTCKAFIGIHKQL